MVVAAIVLLLVSTVLVVVLVGFGVRAQILRRRLVRCDGVFPCSVRVIRGSAPWLSRRARGTRGLAQWSHDVLLLHHGTYLTWTRPLLVRVAQDTMVSAGPEDRARLGTGAVQLTLCLDDAAEVTVAAPGWARERLAGPFLALAVRKMPPSRPERRHG